MSDESTKLTNFVPDEVTFSTPKHQSPITKVRYVEVTLGEVTETFRATRFYEQAAIQSAKERFIFRNRVKFADYGRVITRVVEYQPETKFTVV